jgi:hypothetical protein
MDSKRLHKIALGLTALALMLGACAQPTAAPATTVPVNTQAPADTAAPANTAAPADTAVPATSGPAEPGACPPSTLANIQGVVAGAYPQQYELAEYESLANCKLTFTSRPKFDDRLVDTNGVPASLPPVEQRLPEEPLVVQPYESIGTYGGRLRFASS